MMQGGMPLVKYTMYHNLILKMQIQISIYVIDLNSYNSLNLIVIDLISHNSYYSSETSVI